MDARRADKAPLVTPVRVALVAFLAVFVTWMVVTPRGEAPDESSHLFRVGAVATLHPFGQRPPHAIASLGAEWMTPAEFERLRKESGNIRLPTRYDFPLGGFGNPFDPTIPYPAGAPAYTTTSGIVLSSHARTQILPYVLPALLTRSGWSHASTFYLARLGFALQAALLLALGLWAAGSVVRGRTALICLGMLIALSPLASYLSGVLSPSSLEAAGAVSLTMVTFALCRREQGTWQLRAAWLVSLAAASLSRSIGPGIAFIAVLMGLASAGGGVRRLWANLRTPTLVASAAILVAALMWDPLYKDNLPISESWFSWHAYQADLQVVWHTTLDAVNRLGWLEIQLPLLVRYGWFSLVVFWLAYSIWRGGLRWLAWLLVAAAAYVVMGVVIVRGVLATGFGMQGRYLLPMVMLFPVAACLRLARERVPVSRVSVWLSYITWFGVTVGAMLTLLRRYTVGTAGPILFFDKGWFKPLGGYLLPALGLGVMTLALGWLLVKPPPGSGEIVQKGPPSGPADERDLVGAGAPG